MSAFGFIQLSHIRIQNANALSGPFTIGFPAMTAWMGFVHALERKLRLSDNPLLPGIQLMSAGVVSHHCDLQTYKGPNDYVHSIIGTGNPLDKDGNRTSFIEEARCHLDVSLLIEYQSQDEQTAARLNDPQVIEQLTGIIMTMKIAGGDILSLDRTEHKQLRENNDADITALLRSLMPGYALIERRDLMKAAMADGQDAMDALLDHVTVSWQCDPEPAAESGSAKGESAKDGSAKNSSVKDTAAPQFTWRAQRKTPGWIVPVATGFHGISPLGQALNQRDPDVPHRFAESLVTLGEFRMVHKLRTPEEMLWEYYYEPDENLYLCQRIDAEQPE